jgi:tRNA threonylcarbamoyladenosine biosynthesis protein TsaE
MTVSLPTLRATAALARKIARSLRGRDLLLLSGELGAGKTTLVRYLAGALGIEPGWVSSPSFTLVQRYPAGEAGVGITHVDLYRLKGGSDLEGLGLEEILAGDDLVVVEWPELGGALWAESGRPVWRVDLRDGPRGREADVREPGAEWRKHEAGSGEGKP